MYKAKTLIISVKSLILRNHWEKAFSKKIQKNCKVFKLRNTELIQKKTVVENLKVVIFVFRICDLLVLINKNSMVKCVKSN